MFEPTPFQKWEDDQNIDYRLKPTQMESYVRNILNEDRFLTDEYRVNAGKNFITRAMSANNKPQNAAEITNASRWGYSRWLNNRDWQSAINPPGLYTDESPVSRYNPPNTSCCGRPRRKL